MGHSLYTPFKDRNPSALMTNDVYILLEKCQAKPSFYNNFHFVLCSQLEISLCSDHISTCLQGPSVAFTTPTHKQHARSCLT